MKIRILALIFSLCLLFSFSACSSNENKIFINGNVKETIEVNTTFEDKGVSYPKDLTLITDGSIDTSKLGRQEIKYMVYSSDGELVKEMHRFVTVVDTTAPTYVVADSKTYYVGFNYTINDFISEYSDNYNDQSTIVISNNNFIFTSAGQHKVSITFTDSSNNSASYTTNINAVLDIEKLIYEVYKNQTYNVSSSTFDGSKYIHVNINSKSSLGYFDSGSLHYLEEVETSLGKRATIQISANYGNFNTAHVNFHVSGNTHNIYSYGLATINATNQTVEVPQFSLIHNELNLDTGKMLEELNLNLNTVLNNFQNYMKNTLHLELK